MADTGKEKRTLKQNASIQLACRMLAEAWNDAGLDMQTTLSHAKMDIPWTQESVREVVFNGVSRAMYNGKTSSQLDTDEPSKVWDVINRFSAEHCHGITIPFPSEESLYMENIVKDG